MLRLEYMGEEDLALVVAFGICEEVYQDLDLWGQDTHNPLMTTATMITISIY